MDNQAVPKPYCSMYQWMASAHVSPQFSPQAGTYRFLKCWASLPGDCPHGLGAVAAALNRSLLHIFSVETPTTAGIKEGGRL